MNIRFRCPHCRQKYSVDASNMGKQTTCQKCDKKLSVPVRGGKAGAAAGDATLLQQLSTRWHESDPYLVSGVVGGGSFFLLSLILLFGFSGSRSAEPVTTRTSRSADDTPTEVAVANQPTDEPTPVGAVADVAAAQPAGPSPLEQAIARGVASDGHLITEIHELGSYAVETEAEAQAICAALDKLPLDQPAGEGVLAFTSPLRELALMFQRVTTPQAMHNLSDHGLPKLLAIFDKEIEAEEPRDELLDLLLVFAKYQTREGAERLVTAARLPLLPSHPSWTHILRTIDKDHLQRDWLMGELGSPLPEGNIATDVLVVANRLASSADLATHPFDNEAGVARLRSWLTLNEDDVARDDSAAFQAVITIPHLSEPRQRELLDLALEYPNPRVQLEAAWSAAKVDDPRGVTLLQQAAQEVATSVAAVTYLKAIGKLDAIPQQALDEDFQAKALMAAWLSQPSQFGKPPKKLSILDHRNLVWPPIRERIDVRLLRFEYPPQFDGGQRVVQVGMVGGVTGSLPKLTSVEMPPEDIYALHCCWELQQARDPRAPEKLSVKAGRAILSGMNPDFGPAAVSTD